MTKILLSLIPVLCLLGIISPGNILYAEDISYNFKGDPLHQEIPDIEVGYTPYDAHPETKSIGHWGYNGDWAFDYLLRSIGIDLGSYGIIKRIKLIGFKKERTRLGKLDIIIYFSQDNRQFTEYTKDLTFIDTLEDIDDRHRRILILDNLDIKARYIKIHQTYNDKNFTFSNEHFQKVVKVYGKSYADKVGIYNPDTGLVTKITGSEGGFSPEYTLGNVGTDLKTRQMVMVEEEKTAPPIVKTHSPKAKKVNSKFFLDIDSRYEKNVDLKSKETGPVKDSWVQEIGLRCDLSGKLGGKTNWLSRYGFGAARYEESKSREINTHYLRVNLDHKWPRRVLQILDLSLLKYDFLLKEGNDWSQPTVSANIRYTFGQNNMVEGSYFGRSMNYKVTTNDYTEYGCWIKTRYKITDSITFEPKGQFQSKKYKELSAQDDLGGNPEERCREKDYLFQTSLSHDRTKKGVYRRVQGSYSLFLKKSNSPSREYQSDQVAFYWYCALSPRVVLRFYSSFDLKDYSHKLAMNEEEESIGKLRNIVSYLDLKGDYSLKKWLSLEFRYNLLVNDFNNFGSSYVNDKYTLGVKLKL